MKTPRTAFLLKMDKLFIGSFILLIGLLFGLAGCPPGAWGADALTYDSCTSNTVDEAECKDCCDCIEGDADARKNCRDACAVQDFSQNSGFITVDAPSTLGPDGDYSAALGAGSEQACKEYCDGSSELDCGDRRFCRDACNETFSGQTTDPGDGNTPPDPGDGAGDGAISITQAVSDNAQMKTIAFDGLAFLTGDLCSDSFFPPGK
ncbi:MAG: hypothetical protein GY859_18110, partial [Desulfobacterales bacterium]|nr:hypothetical protein [Desulfobacterales bacterium]